MTTQDNTQEQEIKFNLQEFIEAVIDIENCIDGKSTDTTSLDILKNNYSPTGFGKGLHRALSNDEVPAEIKQKIDKIISYLTKK